jgi:hypothetical protein
MTGIDRDVLITRVLDGEATPEDWAAFRAMADRDPTVWRDLADAQQDRAELASALAEALAVADGVEAPLEEHAGERMRARVRTATAWVGWAAAATLALGVFTGRVSPGGGAGAQQAGLIPIDSPEEALQLYMDKGRETGRVLYELPDKVLLSSSPTPGGEGYTVVYLRQIVERRMVDDFYRLGENEAGQKVPVPMALPRQQPKIY